MKFWKILRKLLDEIFPDWQDKFISYKDLKQQLKLIYPENPPLSGCERPSKRPRLRDGSVGAGLEGKEVTPEMREFLLLLEEEINKINGFFVDKEEEYIIRLKLLKADVLEAKDSREELIKVGSMLADFHGEMILLENYSALNYIGLLKILKKYDKRSGDLIRLPFIQKVLQEPFFRTELIKELVNECEAMIYIILSSPEQLTAHEDVDREVGRSEQLVTEEETNEPARVPQQLGEIECMENTYKRLCLTALGTLQQIRNGSSTVNMFSLPPIEGNLF